MFADEKIVVSSNCTTGGIAATLRAIFPMANVVPFPLPADDNVVVTGLLLSELKDASIWVSIGRFDLANGLNLNLVKLPAISFGAFHPDLCYARKKLTNEFTKYHYNSRIAIWAFNNQIDTFDAVKLYNEENFKLAGYFDAWEPAVIHLKDLFKANNLSEKVFDRFFNKMKRTGVFMHSVNHPLSQTIVELVKTVLFSLGFDSSMIKREIVIPDGLMDNIWPVYPEIGMELGLEGNYVWRIGNIEIDGVRNYLDFTYQNYTQQGIFPMDLIPVTKNLALEMALAKQIKK